MNILKRAREKYGPFIRWKRGLIRDLREGSALVETRRGPVEYSMQGEEGPYVAVMHGCPGGYDQTAALFSGLFNRGFRILSWSRPGYVRTPLDAARTFEEQADVFAALLDALDIDRTAVVGYSAGGPPATHFSVQHPDRISGLILECAVSQRYEINRNNIGERIVFGHLMFNGPSLWLADVIAHHAPVLVGFATAEMESSLREDEVFHLLKDIMSDRERVQILMDLIRSMSPPRLRTKGLRNDLLQLKLITRLPLEHVAAPTLVIHGTDDFDVPLAHAEHAARSIPGSELFIVKGGFHTLALTDEAQEVNEKRIVFLRNVCADTQR